VVLYVVTSRERLASGTPQMFQNLEEMIISPPDLVRCCLDEQYTKTMLNEVGSYVARTLELSHMQAEGPPSRTTNT
jgi:hypothetical protein